MEEHAVPILEIEKLSHDMKRYRVAKPAGYGFTPGQATEVAINKPGWSEERRPFTFTSLNQDAFLEFSIKSYRDHEGVTKKLDTLVPGDELLIHDVWGTIAYTGPGLFIAGGAGITPFIAIFKELERTKAIEGNRLIFANKTVGDAVLYDWFKSLLGKDFHSILSERKQSGHLQGFVDSSLIESLLTAGEDRIYLCGPDPMMDKLKPVIGGFGARVVALVVEL